MSMNKSGYPNEQFDRHGIARVPAATTSLPHTRRHYSLLCIGLAKSLACYVSDDDASLARKDFLKEVIRQDQARLADRRNVKLYRLNRRL